MTKHELLNYVPPEPACDIAECRSQKAETATLWVTTPVEIHDLDQAATYLIGQSMAANTKRAYASDMVLFKSWGGALPSTPAMICNFLGDLSETHAVASIERMLASLGKSHRVGGFVDPTKNEAVKATMSGIRRVKGRAQRQARPILREDLFAMLDRLGDRPKDVRDRAMILIGFASAMRRSELASLDADDVEETGRGLLITVRRSKTDQEGRGRQIAIPNGRTRHCPVVALAEWLALAKIEAGPIFRSVNKHGQISDQRVTGQAVSHVVKARLLAAGYEADQFSGHSLRAGFATSAAMAGSPSHKIRETTGHRSEASLARYIRQADLFSDPAIARVL